MINKVGFVGAGRHVREILLPAAVAAGLCPTAIAARTEASAERAGRPYGAAVHPTVESLARSDVDALIVAVPPDQFFSVMSTAIAASKPVYVEKPGAGTSAEARDLATLARRHHTRVQVGYMKRHSPAYDRLWKTLADEELGTLSLICVRWAMGPFGGRRSLGDWLSENAVHAFDLAYHLGAPLTVQDVVIKEIKGEHIVLVHGTCKANAAFTIQACTTGPWWHDNERVEAFGLGAAMLVRNATECVLRRNDGAEQLWRPNFTIPDSRNLTGTILGFVPALIAFAEPEREGVKAPDLDDAAEVLSLVELVANSAGTLK